MQNYKDLKVWQKSHAFTLKVYEITKSFPKDELYSLTNQLRRASSSIPANIALGSSNEAEYFLILSKDLKYLSENIFIELEDNITILKQCLSL